MNHPNKFEHRPSEAATILFLERRDGTRLECVIDTADYASLKSYHWCAHRSRHTFYAVAWINGKMREMHSLLVSAEQVDHIDQDGLNNRRNNLRAATHSQNGANRRTNQSNKITSRFRGVRQSRGSFQTRIGIDGQRINLDTFISEKEAAQAYDIAARKYFGEFARCNFAGVVQ
jgi:HNH endonuclease